MEPIRTRRFGTPAGELILGEFRGEVVLCDWTAGKRRAANGRLVQTTLGAAFEEGDSALLRRLVEELEEYFAGTRRAFDLPLRYTGTPFESRVWDELRRIPCGETISYGELARRIGNPAATRAVAAANARNPISILVPCHRVVASSGPGGYGGGLSAKRFLLALESSSGPGTLRRPGPPVVPMAALW